MIPAAVRREVRERAAERCEYCGLAQSDAAAAPFHVEHVIPAKHGGSDASGNLALACLRCNLHKGPNLSGIDPASGALVRLFHPRTDVWSEHFMVRGLHIEGATPIGRVTVAVLRMNLPIRVEQRKAIVGGWAVG